MALVAEWVYINENISFKVRDDLSVFIPHIFESLFIEVNHKKKNTIVGVIYRPNSAPKADMNIFSHKLIELLNTIQDTKAK